MTAETWDVDQAVTRGALDHELPGRLAVDRYGVTGDEELAGEPLAVALDQEERDSAPYDGPDDQWVLVDDDDAVLFDDDDDDRGPEEHAMHVVTP